RYGGSLPHTITGDSPSLDDNDNWFNLGNDVSLRANLGSGEAGLGSTLVMHHTGETVAKYLDQYLATVFFITPEQSG
ncbi:hypothetical protein QTP38_31155, partial [Klebsiella oxytoca]|uniref:hypothetical protein n=1 Tax=Klebsiella oxytoca TaxID=571 RepID=UPI0025946BF9